MTKFAPGEDKSIREATKRGREGRSIERPTRSIRVGDRKVLNPLVPLGRRACAEPIVRLIGLRHVLYIMAVLKMRFNDI